MYKLDQVEFDPPSGGPTQPPSGRMYPALNSSSKKPLEHGLISELQLKSECGEIVLDKPAPHQTSQTNT